MYLPIILIVAYLIIIKVIAFFAHRSSQHTINDYFLTNRSLGVVFLLGTIFATVVNALVVTGVPAQIYEGGVLFLFMYAVLLIRSTLMYVMGPKISELGKKHNLVTQGELFFSRFNSYTLQVITAIICILAAFPFLAIQFSAIGKVFSIATQGLVSYELAIIVVAISVGVYLIWGGSRAVVLTDVFQGVILFLILVVTAVLFTYWTGGYGVGVEKLYQIIPEKLTFNENNTYIFIDRLLSWPLAFFLWPQIFQRIFMANSGKTIRRTALINIPLFLFTLFCSMTIGIMTTVNLAESGVERDQFVAEMYNQFWPAGAALISLIVFATGMSTIDSIMLSLSSVISRDFVKKFRGKEVSEEARFNTARLIALILLITTCAFALSETGRGAITPLVTIGASFAALLLWPLLATLYFKSIKSTYMIITMLGGALAIILVEYKLIDLNLPYGSSTIGFLVGLGLFILSTLLSKITKSNVTS